MAALPSPARALWPPLLRAGAFGALWGGDPGLPALGLTVAARSASELRAALAALEAQGVRATLLLPPALARLDPAGVRAATRAGHEVAGWGDPAALPGLEAAAGQPVTVWALEGSALRRARLTRLAAWGVRPLPPPSPTPDPGAIVRLPGTGLESLLPRLIALGYRPGPVQELPGLRPARPRDLAQHLYRRVVEDRFARSHRVVPLTERADAVMRVAARPLPLGLPPGLLPGEGPLPPGTPAAELHLHSPRLVGLTRRSALLAYRAYQRSLRDVARALRERPELHGARVVFAVTLFHGPLEKSGFTLLALPPRTARLYGLGFRLMRAVYGTAQAPSEAEPKLAWMEREAFLARHG